MEKRISVVALALLLGIGVAMLPGTSVVSQDVLLAAAAGEDEITLREADDGQTVELSGDQFLVVDLEGNPSTGYSWGVAEVDEGILRQVGEVEFEPYSPHLTGSAGRQIVRFRAVGEGQTNLMLAYRRSWEKVVLLKTFSVQVQTTGPFTRIDDTTPTAPPPVPSPEDLGPTVVEALPSALNWCDHGGCTPVKDQGACGSCWAFATSGVVESAIRVNDGVTRDLSEQYLVSCNTYGWDCDGGGRAFDFFVNVIPPGEPDAGAVYESEFAYTSGITGFVPSCNPPHTHYEKLTSWGYQSGIPSPADIKQLIYDYGPVYVSVCAGPFFQAYPGGVFETNETNYCLTYYGGPTNHGVVLVGWDDSQGTNGVWVLKNSWSASWGESGYMRIGYGISSVGRYPSYVVYGGSNHPPNTPGSPSPGDGATGQSTGVDLGWTGGDPDVGDSVTYDVYLEANDPTPDNLICNNVSTPVCDPGSLSGNTHHYWYVVATDNHGTYTTGPTWDFTTQSAAGPVVYDSHTIDDDDSGNSYGDDDGIVECGETIELTVTLHNEGTYTATGVTAAITTTDGLVTWPYNTSSSYPDIPAGGTGTNSDDFDFEVHPLTRDGHVIHFDLEITTPTDTWSDSFDITVTCDVDYPTTYLPLVARNAYFGPPPANGGFENGPDGAWSEFSSNGWPLIVDSSGLPEGFPPHSGSWAVWLGGWPNETSILSQAVTVPANATAMGYWYWIGSNDTCGDEHAYVRFDSTTLKTHNLCASANTGGWAHQSVDVTGWRGQAVDLRFVAETDGDTWNSNFFLDDVSFSTDTGPPVGGALPDLSAPLAVDVAATRRSR